VQVSTKDTAPRSVTLGRVVQLRTRRSGAGGALRVGAPHCSAKRSPSASGRQFSAAAAGASGDRGVDLVVQFRDGRTWLGPFALAPAPKLF